MVFLVLLLILSFSFAVERVFYLMGTYAIIDLPSEKEVYRAYKYLRSLEEKLSDYIENSEISKINKNAGERPVRVSEETVEVLKIAVSVAEETKGLFDPTVGSLTINHLRKNLINKEEAEKLINYKNLIIKGNTVFLKEKFMAVDLGGIGKGYALDKVYEFLKTERGFISIGGEIKVWGERRILGIKDPLRGGILVQMVNEKDLCLSTSGNYRRKHIEQRDEELFQITVVYTNCTLADAYATALFRMTEEERREFLKRKENLGVLELYRDGSVFINSAFFDYFSVVIWKRD